MKFRFLILLLPAVFTLLPGCQPVVELEEEGLLPVDAPVGPKGEEATQGKGGNNPSTKGPKTSGAGTSKTAKTSGPPNWGERYKELMGEVHKKFKIPPNEKTIAIEMKDGRKRQGHLLGVSGDKATFQIPIPGKDPATATLERSLLSDATRRRIWVEDAAPYHAKNQVLKERSAYERKHPPAVASATQAEQTTTTTTTTRPRRPERQGPGMIKPSYKPLKANADGSFDVIKGWMRTNIGDPRSIRIHQWGKLEKDPRENVNGFTVDVIFTSSTGGALGNIRQHKRFFLNKSGAITNTGNIRQ